MKSFFASQVKWRRLSKKVEASFSRAFADVDKAFAWVEKRSPAVNQWLDRKMGQYPFLYEDLVHSLY